MTNPGRNEPTVIELAESVRRGERKAVEVVDEYLGRIAEGNERLNAFVLAGFAGVALLIAVVGVAGVLAFSVTARTREFGVRLALGSTPRHLLASVLSEGAGIAAIGIVAGAASRFALIRATTGYVENLQAPAGLPVLGAAVLLMAAAVLASLMPAARASRVDVIQALRPE